MLFAFGEAVVAVDEDAGFDFVVAFAAEVADSHQAIVGNGVDFHRTISAPILGVIIADYRDLRGFPEKQESP